MGKLNRLGILVSVVTLGCCAFGGIAIAVRENGTAHADHLTGTKGADVLRGLKGRDVLSAGAGRDLLIGGRGPDVLRGGPGRDGYNMIDGVEAAAPGRDRIYARDGAADEINCGAGRDLAVVDEVEDGVIDCEVVREP